MLGTVTRVQYRMNKPNRSYGFIEGSDGKSYWFSLVGLIGFEVGDLVSFYGGENEKGYIATNVTLFS